TIQRPYRDSSGRPTAYTPRATGCSRPVDIRCLMAAGLKPSSISCHLAITPCCMRASAQAFADWSVVVAIATQKLHSGVFSPPRGLVSALVVGAQPVPAVELERFCRQLQRPVLGQPGEHGLQGVLFARSGFEGLVAPEAGCYPERLAAVLAQVAEGAHQELLVRDRLAHVQRRVPGGEHREVLVVEVIDRLHVVRLELVLGYLVDPSAYDLTEQLPAGLAADRFSDNSNRFLRLYEAQGHPGPISL